MIGRRKPLTPFGRQMDYRPEMAPAPAVMRRVEGHARAPKPTQTRLPSRRSSTASEREYMGRVAALGCLLCGEPAEVHHVRQGQGMAQRASHWLTVPLCPACHRGPAGIHGDRSALRAAGIDEMGLLALTIERLAGKGVRG